MLEGLCPRIETMPPQDLEIIPEFSCGESFHERYKSGEKDGAAPATFMNPSHISQDAGVWTAFSR